MPILELTDQRIEFQWFAAAISTGRHPVILLHEGLGSVSLWKTFPQEVADATGRAVLAYSRRGYGQSSALSTAREPRFMHDEALVTLPLLRERLGLGACVLLGHSDGASIALIHAGAQRWPVTATVVMAPHVFVEEVSLRSIEKARETFERTDMRARLSRYHADPEGAFRGWNDIWLDPRFRDWNIEEYLPTIEGPVLAIQGREDEYGSMEQIHRMVRAVEMIEVLKLDECGHSPHRDQTGQVLAAVRSFLGEQP